MAIIDVKDLKRSFLVGEVMTPVLRGVSFSINKGDFISIMGPSGSGKSTLLHLLGFLDTPSSGVYSFDGRSILDYSEDERAHIRSNRLGFIFQTFNLLPRMSVYDNVQLPLFYSSIEESLWETHTRGAIDAVGLSHRTDYDIQRLSGGERQRVAIARALVNQPDVIFADEPTGNLDSVSGTQVMEIIRGLNDKGHTIILITHETYTAEYANRILTIKDGLIETDEGVKKRRKNGLKK